METFSATHNVSADRKEFSDKLQLLDEGTVIALIKDLSIDLIAAKSDMDAAKQRIDTIRWKLKTAAAKVKTKKHRRTRSINTMVGSDGTFVWYGLTSMLSQGVYPAKDRACNWRLVCSQTGFSTSDVTFHMRHNDTDFTLDVLARARALGFTDITSHHFKFLITKSFHTAVCLSRMGMLLHGVRAKLKRLYNRNSNGRKSKQIYSVSTASRFFYMLRGANEEPIETFPEIFNIEHGRWEKFSAVLQDPTLYSGC